MCKAVSRAAARTSASGSAKRGRTMPKAAPSSTVPARAPCRTSSSFSRLSAASWSGVVAKILALLPAVSVPFGRAPGISRVPDSPRPLGVMPETGAPAPPASGLVAWRPASPTRPFKSHKPQTTTTPRASTNNTTLGLIGESHPSSITQETQGFARKRSPALHETERMTNRC